MTPAPTLRIVSGPALIIVAGRMVGLAAAFAIPLVLARLFDQSEFGTYKQLFLIYATLFGLAQLGMAESLYYFVPRDPAHAGRQVANAMATLGAAGLACLALLFLGRHAVAQWLGNPHLADHLVPLGLMLGMMLASAVYEIVLIARKQHTRAAWAYAATDIAKAAFFIVPAMALWGLHGVMIGAAAFAAVRLVVIVVGLWREFGSGLSVDLPNWKRQLAYALPFAVAVGIEVLHINWHQYVVASRFDRASFAIYAVGCLQIPLVDLIVTSTVSVMMVEMAETAGAGSARAALALWHETIVRLARLILPLAAFLLLMSHEIITVLYTNAYLASVPIFMLWSLTILASILAVDSVLRVFAQTRFLLLLNVVHLAIVATLAGRFLTAFGLRGAVLVTLLATAIVKSLAVLRISRLMDLPLGQVLPWGRLAAAAGCAGLAALPAYAVTRGITLPPVAALLAGTAVYGLAYVWICRLVIRHPRVAALSPVLEARS